jgi:hypothetical protein
VERARLAPAIRALVDHYSGSSGTPCRRWRRSGSRGPRRTCRSRGCARWRASTAWRPPRPSSPRPACHARSAARPDVASEPHWRPGAPVRIATRGSDLARGRRATSAQRLAALGTRSELVLVETSGDRSHAPIPTIGVGVFTKAVQEALYGARPTSPSTPSRTSRRSLRTAWSWRPCRRAVPCTRCCSCGPSGSTPRRVLPLPAGATVGTSAVRRRALLGALRPDLRTEAAARQRAHARG